MSQRPFVIGHKGFSARRPENTLASFEAALALGVDGIELDVHCTSDRVPVVIHDATVDRTTDGSGAVAGMTLAALRRLDAGAREFDGAYKGQPIPTLAEVLDLTRGWCLLIVEIKAESIEREVAAVIGDAAEDVMVWSFRPDVVRTMRELVPAVPCALLSPRLDGRSPESLFETALRIGQQGISLYHTSVDASLVRAATRRGLTVFTWTANEPEDHRRLIEAGVAGIVTDAPDVLMGVLSEAATSAPR